MKTTIFHLVLLQDFELHLSLHIKVLLEYTNRSLPTRNLRTSILNTLQITQSDHFPHYRLHLPVLEPFGDPLHIVSAWFLQHAIVLDTMSGNRLMLSRKSRTAMKKLETSGTMGLRF
jgi:hypothetical protein